MMEENFLKRNLEEIELIKEFNLKNKPIEYSDEDAINYSSRIQPDFELQKNPDNLVQNALKCIPENLENKVVMDIGCGEGRWSRLMAERGALVTSVDSSQKMIDIALERSEKFKEKIELLKLNFDSLSEIDKQFDLAFSFHAFNNISNIKDIFQTLNKIIKTGGELIIATKLLDFSESSNKILKKYFLPVKNKQYVIYTSGNELTDYETNAKDNGFTPIDNYLGLTNNKFNNEELNNQNIKIYDAILKYKKI